MNGPEVKVRLDARRRHYQPGDVLSGSYCIEHAHPAEVKAVELSVLWYTEGKGEEDIGVHYFQRRALDEMQPFDPRTGERFSVRLPLSPLSYEGRILKIRWCVRVRLFLPRGETLVHDQPFELGAVPPPEPPVEETPSQVVPESIDAS